MRLPAERSYPKRIIVNEEEYTVTFQKKVIDANTLGICDSGEKRIVIKKGITPKERFSTYIHEVLHAIEFEYEVEIKHEVVYALEEALIKYLLENH
jgi:hypothetical protein